MMPRRRFSINDDGLHRLDRLHRPHQGTRRGRLVRRAGPRHPALLLLAMGLLQGCADRLILFPTTDPRPSGGAARREIPFEGGVLEVWTARAGEGPPTGFVLAFPGNADRAERAAAAEAEDWAGHPVEVWAVNYPGYGKSSGPPRMARFPRAALAAFDTLAEAAAGRPIFVSGNSIGGTLALHVAASRDAAGLVLRNPPPIRRIILGRFGWWNLWIAAGILAAQIPGEMNVLDTARRVKVPAVFIGSEADTIVPPSYQRLVLEAYAGPKTIVPLPGADHNDPLDDAARARLRAALDWLMVAR